MRPFTILMPTASADGYGCSGESLVLSAIRDHEAELNFIEHDWRDARYTDPELFKYQIPDTPQLYHEVMVVYFLPFALSRFRSRFTVGMSMWETDQLPPIWGTTINLANAFIVPSEHSKTVFRQVTDIPIEVVPFGTDTSFYRVPEENEDSRRHEDDEACSFLMSGILHYRKGVEFALRAFREEFGQGENVTLTLKTRRNFLDPGNEINTLLDRRIQVIDEDYDRPQMRQLYWTHDCLLATSRGEGSGLTPRDAMATGMPVILTDWSGLSEIADERYNYPVEVEALEPAPTQCSSYAEGITGGGSIGNFARPSVTQIRAHMRTVYEDRAGAWRRGLAAAEWTKRHWTWERCSWIWLKKLELLTMDLP